MRRVVYTIKSTNYSTTDYNLVKNFPEHTYTVHLEEFNPNYNAPTAKDRERNFRKVLAH